MGEHWRQPGASHQRKNAQVNVADRAGATCSHGTWIKCAPSTQVRLQKLVDF